MLLAIRDSLTAFNSLWLRTWQIGTPAEDFLGITVGGTLPRVISIALDEFELPGFIPPQLGQLNRLTRLDLSSNQLTGSIPP